MEQAGDRSQERVADSPIWNNSPSCMDLINLLLAKSPAPLMNYTHIHVYTHRDADEQLT